MGVAYLYSITGTLNLAHISIRIAEVGQDGLITTVAFLFLIVFALKAGLLLYFWLPGSYSVPPTAIAAIFAALLTKVGIYAIFRMFTLIFYHEPQITHLFIGILAAATMVLGGLGAIGYWDLRKILTYNVVLSVGFIMLGLVSFTHTGMMGSIYYLIHDMVIKALVFLIGGTIIHLTGTSNLKDSGGVIRLHPQARLDVLYRRAVHGRHSAVKRLSWQSVHYARRLCVRLFLAGGGRAAGQLVHSIFHDQNVHERFLGRPALK